MNKATCSVDGCERPFSARGYCKRHYERWRLNGDPLVVRKRGTKPGTLSPERHHRWAGGAISYQGMHLRLRRWFGSAKRRVCVDCGERALHWSYAYGDPAELSEVLAGSLLRYSADPHYYEPRCGVCHIRFDVSHSHVYDLDPVL